MRRSNQMGLRPHDRLGCQVVLLSGRPCRTQRGCCSQGFCREFGPRGAARARQGVPGLALGIGSEPSFRSGPDRPRARWTAPPGRDMWIHRSHEVSDALAEGSRV
jgi:hypothetical protein